jgi:uncharacterized protein (TIGR02996 family)
MATVSSLDGTPLSPQLRSFFHAIKADPDDDAPRLIFADWLQEQGDPATAARGEFLRLQVLRHRLSEDDPTYSLLKRREGELFTQHRWTWLGPLRDAARSWTFERGMIQVVIQAEQLASDVPLSRRMEVNSARRRELRKWERTADALWIDALKITEWQYLALNDVAYSPLLAQLNRLDMSGSARNMATQLLFRALRVQSLPFLRHLSLESCSLDHDRIHALSRREELSRLRCLDLQRNRLDDDDARLLAESPHLTKGTTLLLQRNRFTPEGIALLRQAFGDRVHV